MQEASENTLYQSLADVEVCAFIYGRDEDDGDHWDIIDNTTSLKSSPSVTIRRY